MAEDVFRFKQFALNQEDVAMRINTDGVLLGAWCELPLPQKPEPQCFRVLDIGTGSGVIALMLAQRFTNSIVNTISTNNFLTNKANAENYKADNLLSINILGIDPDRPSALRAAANFKASPFSAILRAQVIDLQSFTAGQAQKNAITEPAKFDLIVSNPPYFVDSLKSPSERKNQARHADMLPYKELIQCSLALLKDNGTLAVVLPFIEAKMFEKTANENYLYVKRRCDVFTKAADTQPKRVLLEFCKGLPAANDGLPADIKNKPLAIMDAKGCYTPEYQELMRGYLLAF